MFHHPPIVAKEEHMSTKWHSLKGRFRYMFEASAVEAIENWYNTIAPQRHREAFREVAKGIHTLDARDVPATVDPLVEHRAKHMIVLYGALLSSAGAAQTKQWLIAPTTSPDQLDKFRDVFSAVQKMLATQTTTKEAFVKRPVADPRKTDKNRKRIDWTSGNAAEKVRQSYGNPMGGEKPAQLQLSALAKKNAEGSSKARSEASFEEECEETFDKLHAKQRQNDLEGVYEVNADGCTVYRPKARAVTGVTGERVVATFGNPSAASWRSTTREHIRNHGAVKQEIIKAEEHPAIARVTASLGLCVPTLKPKSTLPKIQK